PADAGARAVVVAPPVVPPPPRPAAAAVAAGRKMPKRAPAAARRVEEPSAALRAPPVPESAPPAVARLVVDSTPRGAEISVDDRRTGVTPLTLETLPPGSHEVRVEKEGHRPYRESVSLESGASGRVTARLAPLPGRLRVLVLFESRGTWASLAIDGEA